MIESVKSTVSERFWSKVDKTSDCWLWIACLRKDGYGSFKVGTKVLLAHRVSYALAKGEPSTALVLDHICRTRHCVNPSHLRQVTQKQNMENRDSTNKNNTSGFRGVYWNKSSRKWRVEVTHHGKKVYLGQFNLKEEATQAVVAKRNELHTHNDKDRIGTVCTA